MPTVSLVTEGTVAIARLEENVIHAISPMLVDELASVVEQVRDSDTLRALVLTGEGDKFFSIGFDIPALLLMDRAQMRDFAHRFGRLCLELHVLPKPTFAAITGHATAGGCILALACDYRYIAAGRKLIGLNELPLGVPIPFVADCILRQLVGVVRSREITDRGEFYLPEDAARLGLVDRILPGDELLPQTIAAAAELGARSAAAFATIKHNRVEAVVKAVEVAEAEREDRFLDCWFEPAAQEQLRIAAQRFRRP
jgi:enoyl-CoA hydratase/carnithine racemase